MSGPRPDPGSEAAGESEYGNDTGFATEATSTDTGSGDSGSGSGSGDSGGSGGTGGSGSGDTTGDDDEWTSPTTAAAAEPSD